MKVMVTGAAGFIGSHVTELLLQRGHEVVAVDGLLGGLYPSNIKKRVLDNLATAGATCIHADLRYASIVELIDGVDAVINQAAMPGMERSWIDLDLYSDCNLVVVGRIAEACAQVGGVRLVQISTSSVYGRRAVGDERQSLSPVSPYGVTKLAAENLVRVYVEEFGLDAVVLRYFSVFGPRQRPDMANHLFCEAMLDARPITVYGDGLQSRTSTYVADAASAAVAALDRGDPGSVFNIAGNERMTLLQTLMILADELGETPQIIWSSDRPGDQRETAAITQAARRELGWEPQWSLNEGLRSQASWHRSRRSSLLS